MDVATELTMAHRIQTVYTVVRERTQVAKAIVNTGGLDVFRRCLLGASDESNDEGLTENGFSLVLSGTATIGCSSIVLSKVPKYAIDSLAKNYETALARKVLPRTVVAEVVGDVILDTKDNDTKRYSNLDVLSSWADEELDDYHRRHQPFAAVQSQCIDEQDYTEDADHAPDQASGICNETGSGAFEETQILDDVTRRQLREAYCNSKYEQLYPGTRERDRRVLFTAPNTSDQDLVDEGKAEQAIKMVKQVHRSMLLVPHEEWSGKESELWKLLNNHVESLGEGRQRRKQVLVESESGPIQLRKQAESIRERAFEALERANGRVTRLLACVIRLVACRMSKGTVLEESLIQRAGL